MNAKVLLILLTLCLLPLALVIGSARSTTPYEWQLPAGFPAPLIPEDNPMTLEKVELGRHLFYDTRLAGNGAQSCSSCHFQHLAFSDGRVKPVGSTGELGVRNAPTLTNAAYNSTLTWANPALTELERHVLVPMFGEFPVELGMTGKEQAILTRFRDDPLYQELFSAAYPELDDPFTIHSIVQALASFVRTLISGNSPYDQFVYQRNREALSASAIRGLNLFFSEELECHHCHSGFNMTNSVQHQNNVGFVERSFHNTGLYNLDGQGAYPLGNRGLFEITGQPQNMGKFRAPTLRNIAVTAPYMHDGSVATLDEVIRIYEAGGRHIETGKLAGDGRTNPHKSGFVMGFTLKEQERQDVIAFLESLTDESFLTDPRFRNPFEHSESSKTLHTP